MVLQHDNPATQHLLLSVGGPSLDGYRYPAENLLGVMLQNHPISNVKARYLERVTAHVWEKGYIVDIPVDRSS